MLGTYFAPVAEGFGIAGTVRPAVPDASACFVRDGVAKSPPIMVCVEPEDFSGPVQIEPIRERKAGSVDAIYVLNRHGPYLSRTGSASIVTNSPHVTAGLHRDDCGEEKSECSVHGAKVVEL